MDHLPNDLVALPTAPYSERPVSVPLDVEECRTALWLCNGNVSRAAEKLKVPSQRLRNFVRNSAYLSAELKEAADRLVDIAMDNIADALEDPEDKARRDTMSRFVVSNIGAERGFGNTKTGLNINLGKGGKLVVEWGDGTNLNGDDANVIEGEVAA